jgi:hypothetical protein
LALLASHPHRDRCQQTRGILSQQQPIFALDWSGHLASRGCPHLLAPANSFLLDFPESRQ